MVGTRNQWKPFYDKARSSLSDLVLEGRDKDIKRRYDHPHRHHVAGDSTYEAARYFDNLGDDGRYLLFSAAPVTDEDGKLVGAVELFEDVTEHRRQVHNFDVMERIAHVQWDTLLFFYGVILCVAGLGEFGYLTPDLGNPLHGPRPYPRQHAGWCAIGHCGQCTGDVCGAEHGP